MMLSFCFHLVRNVTTKRVKNKFNPKNIIIINNTDEIQEYSIITVQTESFCSLYPLNIGNTANTQRNQSCNRLKLWMLGQVLIGGLH